MAGLIIATKRCFLTCEDIIFITVQEYLQDHEYEEPALRVRFKQLAKRLMTPFDRRYRIHIVYVYNPDPVNHPSHRQNGELDLDLVGEKDTYDFYHELVRQIREQKPDALYLDKLVEKMLNADVEQVA
jgi:hypothetical protein